jgi:hypothetical protein
MAHEQDMKAALAELEASSKPNYTEIPHLLVDKTNSTAHLVITSAELL